jgi:hypothetical protein
VDVPRNISPRRRIVRRILIVSAFATFLALVTAGVSRLKPAEASVALETLVIDTVKRGSMLRQVRGYGKLVPQDMQWIPATTEGRVQRILVLPGATVHPDTVLLEMNHDYLLDTCKRMPYTFNMDRKNTNPSAVSSVCPVDLLSLSLSISASGRAQAAFLSGVLVSVEVTS